jgi:hypothetical protein
VSERGLHDDRHAFGHRSFCLGDRFGRDFDAVRDPHGQTLSLQMLDILLFVFCAALPKHFKKRAPHLWCGEAAFGHRALKSCQRLAVQVADEVGSGESEVAIPVVHVPPFSGSRRFAISSSMWLGVGISDIATS